MGQNLVPTNQILPTAGFLKAYDVICHVIVPCPSRNHRPAKAHLELEEYMLESVEDGTERLTAEEGGKDDPDTHDPDTQPDAGGGGL